MSASAAHLYEPKCHWPGGRHEFPPPQQWTGYASDFQCIHCNEDAYELGAVCEA